MTLFEGILPIIEGEPSAELDSPQVSIPYLVVNSSAMFIREHERPTSEHRPIPLPRKSLACNNLGWVVWARDLHNDGQAL